MRIPRGVAACLCLASLLVGVTMDSGYAKAAPSRPKQLTDSTRESFPALLSPFLASSSDNRYVAYSVTDNPWKACPTGAYLLDTATDAQVSLPRVAQVWGVSDDGRFLLFADATTCGRDEGDLEEWPLKVLDLADGTSANVPIPDDGTDSSLLRLSAARLSGDGRHVAFITAQYRDDRYRYQVFSWDAETGTVREGGTRIEGVANLGGDLHRDLSISSDGTTVVFAARCQQAQARPAATCPTLWNPATSTVTQPPTDVSKRMNTFEADVSQNGRHLTWTVMGGRFQVLYWKVGAPKISVVRSQRDMAGQASVSNNGVVAYTDSSAKGTLRRWSARSGRSRLVGEHMDYLGGISSDGRTILVTTPHALLRSDTNRADDVYRWPMS